MTPHQITLVRTSVERVRPIREADVVLAKTMQDGARTCLAPAA